MHSSQVQQMVTGSPNWWSISNMRPPPMAVPPPTHQSPFLPPPSNMFPQYNPNPTSIPVVSSWNENIPESWSQLLMSGLVGEEEKCGVNHFEAKKLENWEDHHDQLVLPQPPNVKQENSSSGGGGGGGGGGGSGGYVYVSHDEFQAPPKSTWSPKSSCVTTFSSNMLDFSNSKPLLGRHPPPDHSSECDGSVTGGALKKARVQASSTQSTFKVRKEKLGDRITSLHQLVSPFGKTDTASVLLEAIGYIRFLQSQIEALSLPYLTSGSGNMRQQQSVQGERNCIFPEDPGQLLNDHGMKNKGTSHHEQDPKEDAKKDLRSRGLCLVPVSCTPQFGSDNGADYWAPALGAGFR